MHAQVRTSTASASTAANGSLSRATQKTIPALPTPLTHKTHLVSSNLDSGNTTSTAHSFFTHGKETSDQQHGDFKTCQVKSGHETTLEIVKEKLGLGLSIVGGSDTPLVSKSFRFYFELV